MGIASRIVKEVAEAEDADPAELPPLGNELDTDALENVVESGDTVHVSFHYAGYEVHVMEDGSVQLLEP